MSMNNLIDQTDSSKDDDKDKEEDKTNEINIYDLDDEDIPERRQTYGE